MQNTKSSGPSTGPLLAAKHTSSKKFPYHTQHSLHFILKSLSAQKSKRTNTFFWRFPSERAESGKGPPHALSKAAAVIDKNIFQLSLIFERDFQITDQYLLHLTHWLKRLRSLKRLTLYVYDCSKITDAGLCCLAKGLKGLKSIKHLPLLLAECFQFTDRGLVSLNQSLKELTTLGSIRLQFFDLNRTTEKGLKRLNGSFNRLFQLENIYLRIPECSNMTDQSLARIHFKRLDLLKRIHIEFSDSPKLTDAGMSFLKQELKGLPNLRKITLYLWGCRQIGDLGLHYIWEMMATLPCLREIHFGFSNPMEISDVAFDDLNKTLVEYLPPLQKIKFELRSCQRITDKSLVSLCEVLKRFVDLQNLHVFFSYCPQITDYGVGKVLNFMKNQASLRKIGINFVGCKILIGNYLKTMTQCFQSESLEKITLIADEEEVLESKEADIWEWYKEIERQIPNLRIKWAY